MTVVWIGNSNANRRKTNGNLYEAKEILHQAEPKFPNNYLFAYTLACYCSQLGKFDEGEAWFKRAMTFGKETVKRMAVNDLDLQPLISNKGRMLWISM